MEFKEQILYIRAKLNLTQNELAKELGVSYQTINRWELGKTKPTKKAQYIFKLFCLKKNILIDDEVKSK